MCMYNQQIDVLCIKHTQARVTKYKRSGAGGETRFSPGDAQGIQAMVTSGSILNYSSYLTYMLTLICDRSLITTSIQKYLIGWLLYIINHFPFITFTARDHPLTSRCV